MQTTSLALSADELLTLKHCISDHLRELLPFRDDIEVLMDDSTITPSLHSHYVDSFTNLSQRINELEAINIKLGGSDVIE